MLWIETINTTIFVLTQISLWQVSNQVPERDPIQTKYILSHKVTFKCSFIKTQIIFSVKTRIKIPFKPESGKALKYAIGMAYSFPEFSLSFSSNTVSSA